MKNIFKEKARLIIARWVILLTGTITLFWIIYYLINGNIPIVKDIMVMSNSRELYVSWYTAPFNMRLLDIFAPIILGIYAIPTYHLYNEKSKVKKDDKELFTPEIILLITSIVFFIYHWIRYGLISGLIHGLIILIGVAIPVAALIFIFLLIERLIERKPIKALWNWLSGN